MEAARSGIVSFLIDGWLTSLTVRNGSHVTGTFELRGLEVGVVGVWKMGFVNGKAE
jgi:hypothetical protein